jgi:phenylalanyl-tRNA synthetase alpha chain
MPTSQAADEINSAKNLKELDAVYRKYLGRKGTLSLALRELTTLSGEERKKKAIELQAAKKECEEEFAKKSEALKRELSGLKLEREWIDVSSPGKKVRRGHLHPLTHIQQKVNDIFTSLGFEIVEGPEVETEWYNFDALNIPKDHPARDMWDTFWLSSESQKLLLRTHTSPVQIRYMETHQPPLRIVAPGRVFRHEASDASHDIQFYQLEGLMVDKEISVANFKAIVHEFLKKLFGENVRTRLRPSFFPFVEPGFEIDMYGKSGWLEIMGAGMVHPNVFKAAGYNPEEWQGFAFGIGLDRIAMLKYHIDDIRLFYGGDLKFLKQF